MAKLSARGRYTLVEATRELDAPALIATHERMLTKMRAEGREADIVAYPAAYAHSSTIWERVSRRLMSDGTILGKRDVRFWPDADPYPGEEHGRRHSFGWKVEGKSKVSPVEFLRIYRDGTTKMRAEGRARSRWTITYVHHSVRDTDTDTAGSTEKNG